MSADEDFAPWLAATQASHARLRNAVGSMSADEVVSRSYDTEWSIAQVLSHLGSGAEIFSLFLRAGLAGEPAPGPDAFGPIWEGWNNKTAADQAADALVVDREFLDHVDSLDEATKRSWHLDMFGGEQDLRGLFRFRLGEHALHTWDVVVVGDPSATVAGDAAALLIDTLDQLVARVGQANGETFSVAVTTSDPERSLAVVSSGDAVELRAAHELAGAATEAVSLPAEAFIRLVYGRLDAEHTPEVTAPDGTLDLLRRTFPGF